MTKSIGRPTTELAIGNDPNRQLQAIAQWINDPKQLAKLNEYAKGFLDGKTMARMLVMSCSKSPDLLQCFATREGQQSMLRALMEAAALKIKPGGIRGRGWLIPRRAKGIMCCIFDPGVFGLVDIARRSGEVVDIEADVVYEEEYKKGLFIYERGTEAKLIHRPIIDGSPRGMVMGAYAIARFKDGTKHTDFMTVDDIEKRRKAGGGNSPAWNNWYEEQCKKTVVRRLCKYLPYSDELDAALAASDRADGSAIDVEYEVLGDASDGIPVDADGVVQNPQPAAQPSQASPAADQQPLL
jgi:recombination protein RecT